MNYLGKKNCTKKDGSDLERKIEYDDITINQKFYDGLAKSNMNKFNNLQRSNSIYLKHNYVDYFFPELNELFLSSDESLGTLSRNIHHNNNQGTTIFKVQRLYLPDKLHIVGKTKRYINIIFHNKNLLYLLKYISFILQKQDDTYSYILKDDSIFFYEFRIFCGEETFQNLINDQKIDSYFSNTETYTDYTSFIDIINDENKKIDNTYLNNYSINVYTSDSHMCNSIGYKRAFVNKLFTDRFNVLDSNNIDYPPTPRLYTSRTSSNSNNDHNIDIDYPSTPRLYTSSNSNNDSLKSKNTNSILKNLLPPIMIIDDNITDVVDVFRAFQQKVVELLMTDIKNVKNKKKDILNNFNTNCKLVHNIIRDATKKNGDDHIMNNFKKIFEDFEKNAKENFDDFLNTLSRKLDSMKSDRKDNKNIQYIYRYIGRNVLDTKEISITIKNLYELLILFKSDIDNCYFMGVIKGEGESDFTSTFEKSEKIYKLSIQEPWNLDKIGVYYCPYFSRAGEDLFFNSQLVNNSYRLNFKIRFGHFDKQDNKDIFKHIDKYQYTKKDTPVDMDYMNIIKYICKLPNTKLFISKEESISLQVNGKDTFSITKEILNPNDVSPDAHILKGQKYQKYGVIVVMFTYLFYDINTINMSQDIRNKIINERILSLRGLTDKNLTLLQYMYNFFYNLLYDFNSINLNCIGKYLETRCFRQKKDDTCFIFKNFKWWGNFDIYGDKLNLNPIIVSKTDSYNIEDIEELLNNEIINGLQKQSILEKPKRRRQGKTIEKPSTKRIRL